MYHYPISEHSRFEGKRMMATRLTDSELAQRVRASNQRRSARQQERRRSAGLVQLNVWVPQSTRTALDRVAAHRDMTISETVADLLERTLAAALALNDTTTPAGTVDNPPVYTGVVPDRDTLMAEVGKLLDEGHTGNEIARRLTAAGFQTANGKLLSGANLLRDYRAWCKKNGAPDTEQRT
jgi:hypothetical protein